MSDHEIDHLFRSGQYDAAAARLQAGLKDQGEDGRDLLLYLLDLGLSLHAAGKYEQSTQAFLKADKVAEIKDYTSLATEAATLLVSDNVKSYKGEDFENVLISTYLAMNYALLGNDEDAIVEAKRVNRKLYLMKTEGKRDYQQNAFARYLSAILYEADGNWGDAYIDYKQAFELQPAIPGIGRDLWRTAWLRGNDDDMEEWAEKLHLTASDRKEAKELGPRGGKGEIIVLYENGISPIKRPNPVFESLPKYYPRYNPVHVAGVMLNGTPAGQTAVLDDIQSTAIHNLDEKFGGIIAKKLAGVVAKEVVAHQIANQTDSPLLGLLARVALYAADQADLRSWNLLPKDLQILRLSVDAGTYDVGLLPAGAGPLAPKTVQVGRGKKVFVNFRYMP